MVPRRLRGFGAQTLYGAANAGRGYRVRSGGQGVYSGNKPTITGALGDALVGNTAKTWATIPFVNAANQSMIVAYA